MYSVGTAQLIWYFKQFVPIAIFMSLHGIAIIVIIVYLLHLINMYMYVLYMHTCMHACMHVHIILYMYTCTMNMVS